jgi:hypothetical protein
MLVVSYVRNDGMLVVSYVRNDGMLVVSVCEERRNACSVGL